ncbi:hypothetical protein PHSY_005885 [Pseudozyma hubeiensis SY62]|uniref:Uncharacterized protein n=1 Tax=Pseudozyma hubeiensis (strain SY62) TaxID=1305764 RepID=R9PAN2_PSEHS|nr:hypothetical protein PHSY_005885 [Pseudozyma hubeiensis SY62]GAC98292.1 hypothetical protein PHSY_005885 [Pseudozyma hubeiensis SY62]
MFLYAANSALHPRYLLFIYNNENGPSSKGNMLHKTPTRPVFSLRGWLAGSHRTRSTRLSSPTWPHRTFYSDLYENEGHLFDRQRDEGRSASTTSPFNSRTQQSSRFSTSHPSAYELERQMHRVSSQTRPIGPVRMA